MFDSNGTIAYNNAIEKSKLFIKEIEKNNEEKEEFTKSFLLRIYKEEYRWGECDQQ